MRLFLPNNQSKWKIDYQPVEKGVFSALKTVVLKNYSKLADDIKLVEQVAETEINSNNFKVTASKNGQNKFFLLRRYPEGLDTSYVKSVYGAMRFLLKGGLKIPEIIKADSGDELIIVFPHGYAMFSFLDANHFRGALEEIESVAGAFGRLDFLLSRLPNAEILKKQIAFPEEVFKIREFSREIWTGIFNKVEELCRNTKDEFDEKLLSLKDFIFDAIEKTPPGAYDDLPKQIIHFDLHPHNLLTDGKKLSAILDFDSLRFFERMRGVAFSMHRLVRQHVVFTNPKNVKIAVANAKEVFLRAYQKENQLTEEELGAVAYFIRHEALSRLSLVIKNLLYKNNSAWKGDFEKQISNIAESEYFEN